MLHQTLAPARPAESILQMASGLWLSRALWAACRLRVPDAIGDVPTGVEAIAAATGGHPAMLRRLMNALAAFGVFACDDRSRFSHTDLSRHLRTDHPASQRAFVESVFGGEHYRAWGSISHSLESGETAFNAEFGCPLFDHFGQNPGSAKLFSEAMTGTTRIFEQALVAAHEFRPFECAVDVGGSQGTLLCGVLARHAEAQGILFDLPEIAGNPEAAWRHSPEAGRILAWSGDFFRTVPAGDLYLLKFILHDWTDAQCRVILRNIRSVIRRGGRVAVAEMMLPDRAAPHPGYLMDLNMMVMTGGRERSRSEYAALFKSGGFKLDRVTALPSQFSVLEAVAV